MFPDLDILPGPSLPPELFEFDTRAFDLSGPAIDLVVAFRRAGDLIGPVLSDACDRQDLVEALDEVLADGNVQAAMVELIRAQMVANDHNSTRRPSTFAGLLSLLGRDRPDSARKLAQLFDLGQEIVAHRTGDEPGPDSRPCQEVAEGLVYRGLQIATDPTTPRALADAVLSYTAREVWLLALQWSHHSVKDTPSWWKGAVVELLFETQRNYIVLACRGLDDGHRLALKARRAGVDLLNWEAVLAHIAQMRRALGVMMDEAVRTSEPYAPFGDPTPP